MVVVGCCFWVVLCFFKKGVLSFDISLFCLCGWGWMGGWMEEGSVSAGMVAYGFLLVEKACIDCRRLILFLYSTLGCFRAVRSGYRTFVAKKI